MNVLIVIIIVIIINNVNVTNSIMNSNRYNSISSRCNNMKSSNILYLNNPLNLYHDITRLGDSNNDYIKLLDRCIVLRCFDYLRSNLLLSDRICTLSWFNQIIEPFFNDNQGEEEMIRFISSLITLNPEKITVTKKSESNPDITVDIVQVIEPRMVASIILATRVNVINDMISQLPLILKENAECAKYAVVCLEEGEYVARRNRRSVLPLNSCPEARVTFSSLNMIITNTALSEMRAELFAQQKKQYIEYLDEFVENVAQSGTLDDLLRTGSKNVKKIAVNFRKWQEGIEEKKEFNMLSKEQDILLDVHKPGSPRHLVERLMLQGLASSTSRDNDSKNTKNNIKRKINNDEDRKENEEEDINSTWLAQNLIDTRATIAESFNGILQSMKERLIDQEQRYTELIEKNGGYAKMSVNGVVSPALEVSMFTSNSPVVQMNATFENSFNKTNNETASDFRITAGKSPTLPSDQLGESVKNNGKPGWKVEDGSQTKADTSGAKQKSITSVLDPPNQRPPPPRKGANNDIGIIEGTNDVDYLDEDFGSIDDFINLGPNARIRIVGITTEDNKRYACLEATGGPLRSGFILRRWVDYDDAVTFLDSNMNSNNEKLGSDDNSQVASDDNIADNVDNSHDDSDLFYDSEKSPFFGGGVITM